MASSTALTSNPNLAANRHHHHQYRAAIASPASWNCLGNPPSLILRRRRRHAHQILTRAVGDGGGASEANPKPLTSPPDINMLKSSVGSQDGYIGLFVRMLGLDNDPLDRDQAVTTLWKYSEGGKECIDVIMQFPGCINLVVNLLKSDTPSTCEAAAGLLRTVSSVSLYRDSIAESGAVEELTHLLFRSHLTSEVKEECLCTLWNLSITEKVRVKMANSDLLPVLIKFLDDEEVKIKEAAGGILANLALSNCNHKIMVEAGVIPKLANLLKDTTDGFKVIRMEAKSALLELSKDEYYMILIIEEGLVRVPIIGAAAYKSFNSPTYSWPSLPDGTKIQRTPRPSRYGASNLLLGLNIPVKNFNLEEVKMNAIVGRSQQQFLARIGAIEMEDDKKSLLESSPYQQYTLLPWLDGIARLVLILGLEDVLAVTRAAHSIADASINEHIRISFKEAGAVRSLVQLLSHNDMDIREAATHALERLSLSHEVCQTIEAEGGLNPLISILKQANALEGLLEKTVTILSRIYDPGKDMKAKFHDKLVNGAEKMLGASGSSQEISRLKEATDPIEVPEEMPRKKIIDTDVISRLIEILRASQPSMQIKVASLLEYVATFEPDAVTLMVPSIESGLSAVFQQKSLDCIEPGNDEDQIELNIVEFEETGLAIAAASRLLTKLLHFEAFCGSINPTHFILVLRKILKSNFPLSTKEWVAACLVKLESLVVGSNEMDLGYPPIDIEVTVYETIPRLVEQMKSSFSYDTQEAAVVELNRIITSRGAGVELTGAVAAAGGIFPLVKLIEEGSRNDALEASLAILYNLSMDAENHSAIIAAGAVPILKRIVLSQGPQWMHALHLLRTLPI